MGVRGLQTYIEKQCPEACKRVSLKEKAEEHKKKFDGCPELVVDGLCFVSQLYIQSGLEWIYGGQYLQFMNLVKEIVLKFKDASIELVFFFDGTVDPLKQNEWVKRRVDKYRAIANLFSDLKSNLQVTDDRAFNLPTFTGQMTTFYLKELGAKVYQTDREADDEIVAYAEKNRSVFGILSQDSDFIIYNTKEYFSLLHLDLEKLSTIHYDRQCLARYLDLDINQLPLFACLAGNHFLPFEKLRSFHQRLLKEKFVNLSAVAPCLSSLIKEKKWSGNPFNMNQLKQISKHVLGNESGVKMIKEGMKSYFVRKSYLPPFKVLIKMPENLEKRFYQRFMDGSLTPQIFNLMFKLRYSSSEVLEDVEATPSALIYREVRQRCYWILFDVPNTHSESNREHIYIEEFSAYHGNQLKKPEIIKPLPLKKLIKGGSPTIKDIQYSLTKLEKFQLFWSIFQLPMDLDVLLEVPKHLLVFSSIINFLIGGSSSGPHLKPFDVAVFVAQAVWEKNASELKKLLVLEDVTVTPSPLIYREIRQRCYGILFNISKPRTLPNGKLILIEEYCGYHGNQLEKPELVEPLPFKKLTGGVPSLNDIVYSLSKSEKFHVFWSVWNLPMDFIVMEKIPNNLLVFSCIINFLIGGSSSGPHLKPFDVAVFVAQAVWEKNPSLLHHLQVPWVDDEAINLSTLFMRGVITAAFVLGICDYPLPVTYAMPWHFFDGKMFHYLYTTTKKRCSVQALCQNQPAAIEMFYYLLQVVTNNTKYAFENFDWKTILADFGAET